MSFLLQARSVTVGIATLLLGVVFSASAVVPIVTLNAGDTTNTSTTPASNQTGDVLAPPAAIGPIASPPGALNSDGTAANLTSSVNSVSVADGLAARQAMPLEQRVQLLEQQLSNLVQMNLPAKIDALEQQIQQLNGQVEQQAHALQATTIASSPKDCSRVVSS